MATEGPVGTFNRTVGVRRDMDEAVDILTPDDVPLQALLNTDTTEQTKVEWMEEALMPQTVTVGTFAGSQEGTSADPYVTALAEGHGQELRPGDILLNTTATAPATQYLVQAVDGDEVDLVLFAGSTEIVATADVLAIIGQYRDEGSDPESARSLERVDKYNLTQIFQEAVEATRTGRKRGQRGGLFGQGDPYDHEVGKKFKELAIRYERTLIHGRRTVSEDAKKRTMGGLFYYITTNSASGNAAAAKTTLNSALRKCYDKGGSGHYVAVVSPAVKSAISANIDVSARRLSYFSRRGGFVVDEFLSDQGTLEIIQDRHMPVTKGFVLDVGRIRNVNFDPFFHELLAKTGDRDHGHIVGEKSLAVKDESAHAVITVTDAA